MGGAQACQLGCITCGAATPTLRTAVASREAILLAHSSRETTHKLGLGMASACRRPVGWGGGGGGGGVPWVPGTPPAFTD